MFNTPKFRIVKRDGDTFSYYAQRKLFDLFWIDCQLLEGDFGMKTTTYDDELWVVERYIKRKLEKYRPKEDDVVVATYYEEN
jgi:hypothetical protein